MMTKRARNISLLRSISVIVVLLATMLTLNSVAKRMSPPTQSEKVITEPIIVDIDYQPFKINTYDDMIEYWCIVYDIDSNLAIAISRLETGHYTSEIFLKCNNFGGMLGSKGFMKFRNSMEGCEAFVEMLKYGYIDQGLDTPEKIQPKYCPGNPRWSISVRRLMN